MIAGPVECTALGNVLVQLRAFTDSLGKMDALRAMVRQCVDLRIHQPESALKLAQIRVGDHVISDPPAARAGGSLHLMKAKGSPCVHSAFALNKHHRIFHYRWFTIGSGDIAFANLSRVNIPLCRIKGKCFEFLLWAREDRELMLRDLRE